MALKLTSDYNDHSFPLFTTYWQRFYYYSTTGIEILGILRTITVANETLGWLHGFGSLSGGLMIEPLIKSIGKLKYVEEVDNIIIAKNYLN